MAAIAQSRSSLAGPRQQEHTVISVLLATLGFIFYPLVSLFTDWKAPSSQTRASPALAMFWIAELVMLFFLIPLCFLNGYAAFGWILVAVYLVPLIPVVVAGFLWLITSAYSTKNDE